MASFAYKALTPAGEAIQGRMDAPDSTIVISRLKELGHIPISARQIADRDGRGNWRLRGAPSSRELGILTRELARLLGAGLPLERSLLIMLEVSENERVRRLIERLLSGLREGKALGDVLEAAGPPFGKVYVNLVRAGEAGGTLELVLERLAEYMERSRRLQNQVVAALIYPAVLTFVSVLSLVVLLTFVVPQFERLLERGNAALPTSTLVVIGVSDWMRAHWWAALPGVLACALALTTAWQRPRLRAATERAIVRMPVVGPLLIKIQVVRFSRTLGTLVANGVPLLSALAVIKNTLSLEIMCQAAAMMSRRLKSGDRFAESLRDTGLFPPLATNLIQVGEETGRLDVMLADLARIYDEEVEQQLKTLLALLEPALILVLGLLVGAIVLSILQAILQVNQLSL